MFRLKKSSGWKSVFFLSTEETFAFIHNFKPRQLLEAVVTITNYEFYLLTQSTMPFFTMLWHHRLSGRYTTKKSVYQVYAGVGINFVTVWEKGKGYTRLANCCCPQFWEFDRPPNISYRCECLSTNSYTTLTFFAVGAGRLDWTGAVEALSYSAGSLPSTFSHSFDSSWDSFDSMISRSRPSLPLFNYHYFPKTIFPLLVRHFFFRLFTLSVKEVVRNRCKLSIPNAE